MALALGEAGAAVAVQDIDLPAAEEVVKSLRDTGAKALALGGDAADEAFAADIASATARELGPIDILVNNAAVQENLHWTEARRDRLLWQYQANVLTPWFLASQCVAHMKAQRWGRIINLSSIQGIRAFPTMLGYGMTKAAIDLMTRGLARDLGPHGITVNAIAPGFFDTYRNRAEFPDAETKKRKADWIALKRIGEPEDCVGALLFLAGPGGDYVTGQVIHVDGGLSAF